MKHLTERKLVLLLVVACTLFVLFQGNATKQRLDTAADSTDIKTRPVQFSDTESNGKMIYLCRLGDEETPAVQIFEVEGAAPEETKTVARVEVGDGIEVTAQAEPVWDYKSISARSAKSVIDVSFDAEKPDGFDWVLTLRDENTNFSRRVRDCLEVPDE